MDLRPAWLPLIENIGLHNDAYLAPGEFAVELSRLAFDDATSVGKGVTWLGVYAHATDVHGDRGNYCGVGIWLTEGIVVDTESALRLLFALIEVLPESVPKDGSQTLIGDFSHHCVQALSWIAENHVVLGKLSDPLGIPFANSYQSARKYVLLEEVFTPTVLPGMLVDAIDILCVTDVPGRTSSYIFVSGGESSIDAQIPPSRRFAGITSMPGAARPHLTLVQCIANIKAEAENAVADLADVASEATRSVSELSNAIARVEAERDSAMRSLEEAESLLDEATQNSPSSSLLRDTPLPLVSDQFWSQFDHRVKAALASKFALGDSQTVLRSEGLHFSRNDPGSEALVSQLTKQVDRLGGFLTRFAQIATQQNSTQQYSSSSADDFEDLRQLRPQISWPWCVAAFLSGAVFAYLVLRVIKVI